MPWQSKSNETSMMCGGLYIEKAALRKLGDWLREQTMYSVVEEAINNAQRIGEEQF